MKTVSQIIAITGIMTLNACVSMHTAHSVDEAHFIQDTKAPLENPKKRILTQADNTAAQNSILLSDINVVGKLVHTKDHTSPYSLPFTNNESSVMVSSDTFRQVLVKRLDSLQMLSDESDYNLLVSLIDINIKPRPLFSLYDEYTTQIQYTVSNKHNNRIFFHKTVNTTFSTKDLRSVSLLALTRRKKAVAMSCNVNMDEFINEFTIHAKKMISDNNDMRTSELPSETPQQQVIYNESTNNTNNESAGSQANGVGSFLAGLAGGVLLVLFVLVSVPW